MKVLCVCLGNICRSPAAEAALRARAPDWEIDSAGTGNWHVGQPPYGPMIAAAAARGLDLAALRARQVTPRDFERFDLIVVMDEANRRDVEAIRPSGAATPVRLFAGGPVPDPYYTRDFEGALDLIEAAADAMVSDMTAAPRR